MKSANTNPKRQVNKGKEQSKQKEEEKQPAKNLQDNEANVQGLKPKVSSITNPEPDLYVKYDYKNNYIIEYRRDLCIGAGSCAAISPSTFDMDDENKAVMVNGDSDDADTVMAAAQSCPVFAIIIKDMTTGKQLFPPID